MTTICDTGPLVAYLDRTDPYHGWSVGRMQELRPPLLVCEPVLTEAAYFLRENTETVEPFFELLRREAIRLEFSLAVHWPRIQILMGRYKQMDLADAAVVVMSEQHKRSQVMTLDRRDFTIYRRNDRQVIPLLAPR